MNMNTQTSQTADPAAHGGCLCGAVHFSATLPEKWCAHCHCTMCRRQHGAGYVTWVGFYSDKVRIEDPGSLLRWHDSSPGSSRGFCSLCGSSLFFESDKWAGETHIALGCIDEPHSFKPQAHAFFDTHVRWMALEDGLEIYP
jgi:hypothetical protein